VGLAGIFDVSTDLEIPYKKADFGLTLASWGVGAGPYIVLPILGPSNLRDTIGRIGDYSFDPINWWGIEKIILKFSSNSPHSILYHLSEIDITLRMPKLCKLWKKQAKESWQKQSKHYNKYQ